MTAESDKRFIERIRSRVGKTINSYGLIRPGDSVLLALSGGKDSMALLEILAWRRQYLNAPEALHAAYIRVEEIDYRADTGYLAQFCQDLDVPFREQAIHIDPDRDPGKQVCFVCSWHRRKALFTIANELNCNRIAFGHHMDDILETLLMNMIYHGTICSMPPLLEMFKGKMSIVRPFASITGNELARYAGIRGYRLPTTRCPYENDSRRSEVRQLILEMTRLNKKAKQNLFRSMTHIEADYLP